MAKVKDEQPKAVAKTSFTKEEVESGKLMGILAYLGILCLIPYFAEKENKFVIYHAKQGLNLFILSAIAYAACVVLTFALIGVFLYPIVSIIVFVLAILGIVNVCNGEAKELPIIDKLKLIK